MNHEGWSFEDHDEDGSEFLVFPDRGLMNPYWAFRSIMALATPKMYLHGMMSFAKILEEGGEGEMYQALEILDMQVQSLMTGEYVNPYDWLDDSDEPFETEIADPIKQEDIDKFLNVLGVTPEGEEPDYEQD